MQYMQLVSRLLTSMWDLLALECGIFSLPKGLTKMIKGYLGKQVTSCQSGR